MIGPPMQVVLWDGCGASSGLPTARMSPLDGVQREAIKITDITVTNLGYLLKPEEQWPDGDNNSIIHKTETVIVEVSTDAGITGIGGASRYNGPEAMKEYAENVIKPRCTTSSIATSRPSSSMVRGKTGST